MRDVNLTIIKQGCELVAMASDQGLFWPSDGRRVELGLTMQCKTNKKNNAMQKCDKLTLPRPRRGLNQEGDQTHEQEDEPSQGRDSLKNFFGFLKFLYLNLSINLNYYPLCPAVE